MTDVRLVLDESDLHSTTWLKLHSYLLGRIEELRESNDADKDAVDTARLRGRIAELKNLLTQAVPAPAIVMNDS